MNDSLLGDDDAPSEVIVTDVVCTNPLSAEPSALMVSIVKQWGLAGLILGALGACCDRILDRWRRRIFST